MIATRQRVALPQSGVQGELAAIAERREQAIEVWDGDIQRAWTALLWHQEQARRLAERVTARHPSPEARAWVRCMDAVDALIAEISAREAEARAEVRGMEPFIAWAKQGSRIDAALADQFRLGAAGLDTHTLEGVA